MHTLIMDDYHSPGLNQWQRMHWRDRKREKKRCEMYLFAARVHDLPKFTGRVRVYYTRCRKSGPPLDDDNMAASFKPIGDALQAFEVIGNDRDIDLVPVQVCNGTKQTVLGFEEI